MSKISENPLVAVDSMVLVWGVRRDGTAEMLQRAKWLFDHLSREKAQIVVPTIVVAEYLSHVDVHKHAETIELMRDRFILPPFDVKCASLAAQLFTKGATGRADKGSPDNRKCLRADSLIVATAKSQGVTVFYSHDARCRAMAKAAKMDASDLPNCADTLFDED